MIVSYGSSPPVEVYYAETEPEDAPTASIIGPDACFRQIEFAGILKGTPNRDLAEAFIDFMLDVDFQEDIPLQMFVFPVNPNAALPDVFTQYAQIPDQPATLDPALINANREAWINAWMETVLE
jgi:thiamine transport system substrate-binding protein